MAVRLNFRERGIPSRIKKRILILCGIFLGALLVFQFVLNGGEKDTDIEMEAPTLPLITMEAYGRTMGELHGYVNPMDACYMRDAIIPLEKERILDTTIHTYGYDVESVSYELRSLDTERKIADTPVTDWETSQEEMRAQIQIENLVDPGEEYLLVLILHGEDRDIYYYTRIMLSGDGHVKECLDFARYFHETAMSSKFGELSSYMETSAYTDKDTLADVGIDSGISQVGWQGFTGEMEGEPVVSITDMNETYVSLVYSYLMKEEKDGASDYYQVEEYFKIRYTPEQIYLLDYRRTMTQVLRKGAVEVKNNVVNLGVAGREIEYLSNETGTIVSFVQAGELYQYNQNRQTLTHVFGFMEDPLDKRESYREHAVRILNIDETGNMDFVVYGYMNRGAHEGECGINLYHYDSSQQETVEQLFISSTHSYQILNANFSDLLYKNSRGDFYIMMGGTLAKVGLDDLVSKELMKGLRTDQYAVSASGQYVAWITDGEMSDHISVIDLETEKVHDITAEPGCLLKPLAFMTEDLVYGIANERDILPDAAGAMVYPMKQVKIVSIANDFAELKNYNKEGFFVTEVEKDSFTLYLNRVTYRGGTYVEAPQDTIKDSTGEQNKVVDITLSADEVKGSVTKLTMAALEENKKIRTVAEQTAQLAVGPQARDLSVTTENQEETYFVYVGNRVTMTTQNLTRAIAEADTQLGLVVDNKQRYIWKRGKNSYMNAFRDVEVGALDADANSSAGAISAMLVRRGENGEVHAQMEQGATPLSILQKSLKEELVLDLTGCTLNQVLYYVSQGSPVYARTGENEAVLLIGYDAASVVVYQSVTDTYKRIGMTEASALFEGAGNVYISYVE